MDKPFCVWWDGPVVEAWAVAMGRTGKLYHVEITAKRPVAEAEVRAHVAALYERAYGPMRGLTRIPVPSYCADRPHSESTGLCGQARGDR